ncbi:DEAD/DEAH box helicase [Leptospirillum ferriphilum]|uniref:Putative helicase n=1 Tax=Leptospirillum ferriphilum (strain ML-04) TaxID=1048260 RepID=J9ZE19_LEPFM|nr:type ISP restriction/modification enzyme [Leptospirillum ferriphilum]AFS53887.1 putative helicase [Leptospirillum ferriphilum ML-04]
MTTLHSILEQIRQHSQSEREKGDRFEILMKAFFKADPTWADRFEDVWIWKEWPELAHYQFSQQDTGIDLVAKEWDGGWCAIQCKCFDPHYNVQKADIDSFFTLSGKKPFSARLIVSTTDKWSVHAEEALADQQIPINRIGLSDLADSRIDWSRVVPDHYDILSLHSRKSLLSHQQEAVSKVLSGFQTSDRGKLVMACGTGKTFTSLKIAEAIVPQGGAILFLSPSISLVSQSLTEWTREAEAPFRAFAVCSDSKVGKRKDPFEDIRAHDLAYPATTDPVKLAQAVQAHASARRKVIFSTYQSIEVLHEAQIHHGLPEFDLVICDEAHRTTGATQSGEADSAFVAVHRLDYLLARKRLFMTATPRIYADSAKSKAKENDIQVYSMDDPAIYGPEFHRLGFGEAVKKGLLSDYKVLVLVMDQQDISRRFPYLLSQEGEELKLPDVAKIIGCWNGLSKRVFENSHEENLTDPAPMKRAVAFARSIADSKQVSSQFDHIVTQYLDSFDPHEEIRESPLKCEVNHVDGTFNILLRNSLLDWLKSDPGPNACRILSNARCLSEGVDVPSLDAVIFLNPRDSVIDVVQSVGRIMRKSPGKEYGYIILPIATTWDMEPEEALDNNENFRVVWTVLQALRAHDERLNAEINKIELNKKESDRIQVIGLKESHRPEQVLPMTFDDQDIGQWKEAIYARIVKKCGTKRYWESWANDVATIAQTQISRIKGLLSGPDPHPRTVFNEFLESLRSTINPEIRPDEAIEMLSQHIITKPVFDALFAGEAFVQNNPVSQSLQKVLDELEGRSLAAETKSLESFYEDVRERASGIDNIEGRQKIVIELYDKFFKTAFPRISERLGIVYTPIEVVDFIIRSADSALRDHFGVGLTDRNVHILDPFAGTGSFLVRLLQSGLIRSEDLPRKYRDELHANEIVLLAYYIAAINIESVYQALIRSYESFNGIVLTDTFQMGEKEHKFFGKEYLPENNERVRRQKEKDIRVIIGNPPYRVNQGNSNDNNPNPSYDLLDESIRKTYALGSTAVNKNSLYDSYIRAFRWASNRIKKEGVICYVSNGGWIDGNTMDGFRKSLAEEFTGIYVFNLRGNQRTSGELSRKEGGKVFGSGSRAPIAITLLVKNPQKKGTCAIHYHDIGDYLSREEKLSRLAEFGSIANVPWERITPNEHHDWINVRSEDFGSLVPLNDAPNAIFSMRSNGVQTNRDVWVYNFSKSALEDNISRMIAFYNDQVDTFGKICQAEGANAEKKAQELIDTDPKKIKWTSELIEDLAQGKKGEFKQENIGPALYRPFTKSWIYYDPQFNHRFKEKLFPSAHHKNLAISVTGTGSSKDFSCLMVNTLPDLEVISKGQCFPLYYYEKAQSAKIPGLTLSNFSEEKYVRKDAVTDKALTDFREHYQDEGISKEDIFYYVYGVLHSPEYRERFASDLKKMLPRIPFVSDFWGFSKAGRELAHWHLNYETLEPWPLEEKTDKNIITRMTPKELFRVEGMKFGRNGKEVDKTTIVYNNWITLSGIPLESYKYVVNGKPALEWVMERYAVKVDKDSGIKNDPNLWSEDPRYLLDLVKRVVRVSLEMIRIIKGLPALTETGKRKSFSQSFFGGESIAAEEKPE